MTCFRTPPLRRLAAASAAALLAAASGAAQAEALPPTPVAAGAAYVAIGLFPARGGARLTVSSPGFADGGDVPFEYTGWRANTFPGLSWSKGPPGTRSYVALLQDADGLLGGNDAILHWTMYDIPPEVTSLPLGMMAPPPGAMAGPNRNGPAKGYLGPRTGAAPSTAIPSRFSRSTS